MTSQNIRVFLAIAEHKSISGAARALYFSQSAVSQSLTLLEKELGVQLVQRSRGSRQLKLTPAGEAFVPLAQQRQELDARFMQFIWSQNQKSLRLAANATCHQYLVPEIAQNLMYRSSDLELRLISALNKFIPTGVENGLYDAAFFFDNTPASPAVTTIPFFRSECCILCSADTILPDRPVSPKELDPHFEVTHDKFSKRPDFRAWHRQHFPADIPPRIEVSMFMSLDNYLTDPRYWSLVPLAQALFFVSRKPTQLAIRRVDPVPYYQQCSIVISKTYLNTAVIDDLLHCCREYLDARPHLINCLPK